MSASNEPNSQLIFAEYVGERDAKSAKKFAELSTRWKLILARVRYAVMILDMAFPISAKLDEMSEHRLVARSDNAQLLSIYALHSRFLSFRM